MQRAVASAEAKHISIAGLNAAHLWERHGRYISFSAGQGVEAWFGTEFRLWHGIGSKPLWLVFPPTMSGRAGDVRSVLERWTRHVVSSIVERLRNISEQLRRIHG